MRRGQFWVQRDDCGQSRGGQSRGGALARLWGSMKRLTCCCYCRPGDGLTPLPCDLFGRGGEGDGGVGGGGGGGGSTRPLKNG